ncbi:PREDICTED: WRKY transcription factor 1-like isoform X1 [Nicotiana attenuata]|uniref:Wrky transcription factor 20 n=2 Tax=Nicotiana attenuata TaxID=49451 RepID=A0A1J6I8I4_NICAT|nr:PREDICTED: WRKY transcription factor 1-like isoform X1 [Nicotiana attenuata]OIT00756.1 putative wrky transcription factor 20 [Nicotiana attenuata]
MGTHKEDVTDEVSSEKLQQKQDLDTVTYRSELKEKGICESMSAEVISGELQKRVSPDALEKSSQSNQDENALSTTCQEVSGEVKPKKSVIEGIEKFQQKPDPDTVTNRSESKEKGTCDSVSAKVVSDELLKGLSPDSLAKASESSRVSVLPKKEPYIKSCESDPPVKDRNVSLVPGKASDSSQNIQREKMEVVVSQPNQEQVTYSTRPEKALDKLQPRRNLDMNVQALPSDQEIIPFRSPEKPSEDGYNWRKYGQKLVRGNEFTRSYYKCTSPNCLAKKQVERSHDGHITNIHYIAKHEHPKPLNSPQISPEFVVPMQMKQTDMPMGTPREAEGKKSIVIGQTCQSIEPSESSLSTAIVPAGDSATDTVMKPHKSGDEADNSGGPDPKRQKREVPRSDEIPPIKSHSEPQHIVQTRSEVDIVNDGYRWRKYGQKLVKGNPNPRSYYRCSSAGCPAKKHVERASHDPKLVVTAYEGQHDHDIPPSRTVMQNAAGADSNNTTRISGESTPESGENKHVGLDRVVHIGAN